MKDLTIAGSPDSPGQGLGRVGLPETEVGVPCGDSPGGPPTGALGVRSELERVYAREVSRLLWRAAFELARVEEGILRGTTTVVLEDGFDPEGGWSALRADVEACSDSARRDGIELGELEQLETELRGRRPTRFGDWREAREFGLRALLEHPALPDQRLFAAFERASGAPARARAVLRRAMDQLLTCGEDPVGRAGLLTDLARIEVASGALWTARELLVESMALTGGASNNGLQADFGWHAGRVGDARAAVGFDGLSVALELGDPALLERSLGRLAEDPPASRRALARSLARLRLERRAVDPPADSRRRCRELGRAEGAVGRYVRAWAELASVDEGGNR